MKWVKLMAAIPVAPQALETTGNWVGDHQPPTALNPPGSAQVYQPQCLQCMRQQGGQVSAAAESCEKGSVRCRFRRDDLSVEDVQLK